MRFRKGKHRSDRVKLIMIKSCMTRLHRGQGQKETSLRDLDKETGAQNTSLY